MKPIHTPGPWRSINRVIVANVPLHGLSEETEIAVCSFEPRIADSLTANADLIAAAPELLTALENMVWTFEKLGNGKAIKDARAVIAKVRTSA